MRDPRSNLYIVNLFTQERIILPPVESQLGTIKIERTLGDGFRISNYRRDGRISNNRRDFKGIAVQSPVFWIDEKTKDYVVYSKKGDTSWNQIPGTLDCFDLVYKDLKLYFLSSFRGLKIFDFSGEIPQETFHRGGLDNGSRLFKSRTKLVVTITGDVLTVERIFNYWSTKEWSFHIYKVFSPGVRNKLEQVDSLGDEAMLYDLGITVLANDFEGFNRNSIYFIGKHSRKATERNSIEWDSWQARNAIYLFNLETQKVEQRHNFDCSSIQIPQIRWFLPSFT